MFANSRVFCFALLTLSFTSNEYPRPKRFTMISFINTMTSHATVPTPTVEEGRIILMERMAEVEKEWWSERLAMEAQGAFSLSLANVLLFFVCCTLPLFVILTFYFSYSLRLPHHHGVADDDNDDDDNYNDDDNTTEENFNEEIFNDVCQKLAHLIKFMKPYFKQLKPTQRHHEQQARLGGQVAPSLDESQRHIDEICAKIERLRHVYEAKQKQQGKHSQRPLFIYRKPWHWTHVVMGILTVPIILVLFGHWRRPTAEAIEDHIVVRTLDGIELHTVTIAFPEPLLLPAPIVTNITSWGGLQRVVLPRRFHIDVTSQAHALVPRGETSLTVPISGDEDDFLFVLTVLFVVVFCILGLCLVVHQVSSWLQRLFRKRQHAVVRPVQTFPPQPIIPQTDTDAIGQEEDTDNVVSDPVETGHVRVDTSLRRLRRQRRQRRQPRRASRSKDVVNWTSSLEELFEAPLLRRSPRLASKPRVDYRGTCR